MPAINDLTGRPVIGPKGRRRATVRHVLFHPNESRAVALEVQPVAFLYLVPRKPSYLPLTADMMAACGETREMPWPQKRLPKASSVEKEIGVRLAETVIWSGMDVCEGDDGRIGKVADVGFSRKSGRVLRLVLTEGGSLADLAVGRTEIPGEFVIGFSRGAVRVDPAFRHVSRASGGFAAASAKGSVYAKHGAEKAADAAFAAGVAGLEMVERSFRTGLGRKAMRGLKRAGDAARKAMDGDEE